MENLNQGQKGFKDTVKKYLPVTALILLTILLMFFFRENKREIGKLIENGKNNLVSFYAQNLKPLFATTDISNEDVFNFALYQSIPIDKQNDKILTVTNQGENNQVFEIKSAEYNPRTDNYNKFVQYLGLNSEQKQKADSILDSFKKDIYVSILLNDKNTVAVNSKIGELQKAILANLISFAREVNEKKANELFQSHYSFPDNNNINNFIVATRENPQKEYVFITPDTAFKSICTVDMKDLNKEIENKLKTMENIKSVKKSVSANWNTDFRFDNEAVPKVPNVPNEAGSLVHVFEPDSHFFKVVVPIPEIPALPGLEDSLKIHLEKTAENLRRLSFTFDKKERLSRKYKRERERVSNDSAGIEFYFKDPTEIVGKTIDLLRKKNFKDWEDFGQTIDSFARSFSKAYTDSILIKDRLQHEKLKSKKRSKNNSLVEPKDSIINNH